jgi:hypothetical protein
VFPTESDYFPGIGDRFQVPGITGTPSSAARRRQ